MKPVEAAERWSRWTAVGQANAISRVFVVLDATLPGGWRRLSGDDLQPYSSAVKTDSGWYALAETAGHVGVTLSIERPREVELRGGWTWFAGPPHPKGKPSVSAAWDQINRFLEETIAPAARSVGAKVTIPTVAEIFLADLPGIVRDRLLAFSEVTRKQLPLNGEEAVAWREAVIAAFRTMTMLEGSPFYAWLVDSGWTDESADELVLRYFDHSMLLSLYKDEVSAA